MDWFRRNWPDLLIGIALVAVIAGIIATLITGGSFFPVGQTTRTSTPPAQSSGTSPSATAPGSTTPSTSAGTSGSVAPGSATSGTATSGPASTTPEDSATGASTASGSGTAATGGTTSGDATGAGSSGSGIAVLPPSDDGGAAAGAASTPAAGSTAGSAATSAATSTSASGAGSSSSGGSAATSGASAGASTAGPSSAAATGPGSDAPFRISVGAFGQAENAQRQAATFRDAGYPVFTADQGDLTIVLVGPYASQSEAEAVAARIRAGGFGVDPVIYRFQGGADTAPSPSASSGGAPSASTSSGSTSSGSSSAAASAASSGASASGGATSDSAIPTSASGRYLQVGAYGNADSAQPQKERLASLGFTVTERTEGGLVKLLIGPFDAARLQQAQSELNAAGIESFPR